jgi:hypothetical protein
MNKEDVLKMSAGRELDMLVAEKVMGWKLTERIGGFYPPGLLEDTSSLANMLPAYSTDIAAVWKVIEKTKMFDVKGLSLILNKSYDNKWCVSENEYGDLIEIAGGDTAPAAICKAALLVILDENLDKQSSNNI